MARKLYIFTPSVRVKVDGRQNSTFKWLGSFTASYAYLGDHHARMLGVGNRIVTRRLPAWSNGPASGVRPARGGASHDPSFWGWG